MLCLPDCTPVRGAGYKMRDPSLRLHRAKGCRAADNLTVVRNITPPPETRIPLSNCTARSICPAPKSDRICYLLQELYHLELTAKKLKLTAPQPSATTVQQRQLQSRETYLAALQEITKLKQAIYLQDQHATEIHLQRKDSADELKEAEGTMEDYMRDAMRNYVEVQCYMDQAKETLDDKRADVELDRNVLIAEQKKRLEWRNDTISMEPEFSRLMAQVEWFDKQCAYLDQQCSNYNAETSRINEILDCCDKIYAETLKKSAEEEKALSRAFADKASATFALQRITISKSKIKRLLDDAAYRRDVYKDEIGKTQINLRVTIRQYPVQNYTNLPISDHFADQELSSNRTTLQQDMQQEEDRRLEVKRSSLLRRKDELEKLQNKILLTMDPEGDYLDMAKSYKDRLDALLEQHGQLFDGVQKILDQIQSVSRELGEKDAVVEQAEAYMDALSVKIQHVSDKLDRTKRKTDDTFQDTVCVLRHQVEEQLQHAVDDVTDLTSRATTDRETGDASRLTAQ